jgi:hypothetical protein
VRKEEQEGGLVKELASLSGAPPICYGAAVGGERGEARVPCQAGMWTNRFTLFFTASEVFRNFRSRFHFVSTTRRSKFLRIEIVTACKRCIQHSRSQRRSCLVKTCAVGDHANEVLVRGTRPWQITLSAQQLLTVRASC